MGGQKPKHARFRGGQLLTWTLPQRHWPDVVVDDICANLAVLRSCVVERDECRSSSLLWLVAMEMVFSLPSLINELDSVHALAS